MSLLEDNNKGKLKKKKLTDWSRELNVLVTVCSVGLKKLTEKKLRFVFPSKLS
jgi:hypothetical protein